MKRRTLFITGTDTHVGKTVLAALLARHLRETGLAVAALKPLCSGSRDDAQVLHAAMGGTLALDEINPWHFPAPLAPLLAARRTGVCVTLGDVLAHVRHLRRRFAAVLIEGAGGLLSPLGEDFNARDLLVALRATPVVVCPNRLGAINQTLLVMRALPRSAARDAQLVLVNQLRPDASSRMNPAWLAEELGPERVQVLPWLDDNQRSGRSPASARLRQTLDALLG